MCRTPAGPGAGAHAFGVYLQDAGIGDGAAGCRLSVDTSWLDATGADDGVACMGGSLVSARIVAPAGWAFGAGGVLDVAGAVATHVVIEPEGATAPAGETSGGVAPGCGAGQPAGGADPATEQPGTGPTTDPAVKPTAATRKTTTTSKTTVTKTTLSASTNQKSPPRSQQHSPRPATAAGYRLRGAFPTGNSAPGRRISLLRCSFFKRAQCPSIHHLLLAAHRELTTQNTGLDDESINWRDEFLKARLPMNLWLATRAQQKQRKP